MTAALSETERLDTVLRGLQAADAGRRAGWAAYFATRGRSDDLEEQVARLERVDREWMQRYSFLYGYAQRLFENRGAQVEEVLMSALYIDVTDGAKGKGRRQAEADLTACAVLRNRRKRTGQDPAATTLAMAQKQGQRAGRKKTLHALGFATMTDALAFVNEHRGAKP